MPMIVWLSSEEQVLTFILYMYILIVPSFQCDVFWVFFTAHRFRLNYLERGEKEREVGLRREEELEGDYTLLQLGFWVWKFIIRLEKGRRPWTQGPFTSFFMDRDAWKLQKNWSLSWEFLVVKALGSYFGGFVSVSDDDVKDLVTSQRRSQTLLVMTWKYSSYNTALSCCHEIPLLSCFKRNISLKHKNCTW